MSLDDKVLQGKLATKWRALQGIQTAMVQFKMNGYHLLDGFDSRITVKMNELDEAIERHIVETESEMAKQGE